MAKRGRRPGRLRSAAAGGIDLMQYAVAGARARLQELAHEAGELFRHFPQLRTESPSPWGIMGPAIPRRRGPGRPPYGAAAATAAPAAKGRRRRRRRMSAEARAKISAAQKRRWAEYRKKAGTR
jgi:hypothetical protein